MGHCEDSYQSALEQAEKNRTELTTLQQRLAEAGRLLREGESYLLYHLLGREGVALGKKMQAFLTPTPTNK